MNSSSSFEVSCWDPIPTLNLWGVTINMILKSNKMPNACPFTRTKKVQSDENYKGIKLSQKL